MILRTMRQQLNLAKPELWLVAGTHYYTWALVVALMSLCAPLVLFCNFQAVVTRGWYGILNLGFLTIVGVVSLLYVLSRLPVLVRFDRANQTAMEVARREVKFLAWFTGSIGVMVVTGLIIKLVYTFA